MRSVYICFPFLAAFLVACEVDPFSFKVGEDMVLTTTKVTMVDTLTVNLSTYKKDSIVTSNTGTMLAGVFHDELFGEISARSYFQIGLPELYDIDYSEICDSVSLLLQYNQYYAGDTLQEQVYNIYALTEDLEEDEDGGIYYSTSFSHSLEPIGAIRFTPNPIKEDELEIPLNKEVGEEILEYLQENSSTLYSDDFLDLFKGFVIEPAESESQSVLGFNATDSTLFLKLYTHEPGPLNPQLEHTLPMTNSEYQYNQISFDLSIVPEFNTLSEKKGLAANCSEDIAYVYGGLGLYTKVTFPYLGNITGETELNNGFLVSALLYLDPVEEDSESSDILGELRIYEAEKNGDMGSRMIIESGVDLTATYSLDPIYPQNSVFVFDISDYVGYGIADYYLEPEFGFYLDFSSAGATETVGRLMLDGSQNAANNMRIELTYFYYDQ